MHMKRYNPSQELGNRTIADFGDQWTRYTDNEGAYGSVELLADILGPLLPLDDIKGKRLADIGSGTGRIVRMLLAAGAKHVIAIEPSQAAEVMQKNLAEDLDRVEILKVPGDEIPNGLDLDIIVSIGVIHHIPDPASVVAAACNALRPGGQFVVWLYGKEGNRLVVALIYSMRAVTKHLPHSLLAIVATACNLILDLYIPACRRQPVLPLAKYVNNVLGKFSRQKRYLVIYDQLRPAYAKYYTKKEARTLLENAGFIDVALHNRHNYSWTVSGRRPE